MLIWNLRFFSLEKSKTTFFFEKKIQNGRLKKGHFSKSPILNIFLWKFYELVLGLVDLIDAKGIEVAQPALAPKQPKNTKNAFFACFWAYVGQPHNHIDWATSMPFASINPTHPRTNPRNFHEKILRIGKALKMTFV